MNINSMGKTELRAACKAAGIKYSNMNNAQMRDALSERRYFPEAQAAQHPAQAESAAVVTTVAPVAAPSAAPTVSPAAPVIPEILNPATAAPRDEKNGIRRPREGSACRAAWDALDLILASGKNPSAEDARLWAESVGANPGNAVQELYPWRKYNGIKAEAKRAAKEVCADA